MNKNLPLFLKLLCFFNLFLNGFVTAGQSGTNKVLMLVSAYGGESQPALNYDLEELAQVYLVLRDNGVAVDIISPKGGAVYVHNKKDELAYMQRFKQLTNGLHKLRNTKAASEINPNEYDALFIVGGDGAMFDLPVHAETQKLISHFAQNQQPVAAVCHGPAALVHIMNKDGKPFIAGKQINSFTRLEDQAFSSDVLGQFPFVLQDKLEEIGANFVSNRPMLPYVAVFENLITAQNPMSVADAAEALLLKLGKTPKPRELFKDEATMKLIARARSMGTSVINVALAQTPELYNLQYLALYGFYSYDLAESQADKLKELELKAAIQSHFSHPHYMASLIKAYVEQKQLKQAANLLTELQDKFPKFESLQELKLLISPKIHS